MGSYLTSAELTKRLVVVARYRRDPVFQTCLCFPTFTVSLPVFTPLTRHGYKRSALDSARKRDNWSRLRCKGQCDYLTPCPSP
ncbi:UNVERIFIED_CONTAM: hypothetical protein FKN15_068186 [Acipenser sinensis]